MSAFIAGFMLMIKIILTFKAIMLVRLKDKPIRTAAVITTNCIATDMGTSSIVSETLINICNDSILMHLIAVTIKVCSPLQYLTPVN